MTAVVQSKSNPNATEGSPATSYNTLPTVGNYAIVTIGANGDGPVSGVTDNQGNIYQRANRASNSGGGFTHTDSELWFAPILVASGTVTVSFTMTNPTGAHIAVGLLEVSGLSGVVDVTNTAQDISGANTSLTVTNGSANANASELVVAIITTSGSGNDFTVPPSSGYSTLTLASANSNGVSSSSGYKVTSGIENSAASWTWGTAGFASAVIVTFLPASVAAPPPSYPMASSYYM